MNALSPRRLTMAAATGAVIGASYVAIGALTADPFTIDLPGFRTGDTLTALGVAVAGGAIGMVALLVLEHLLRLDRDGVVREAAVWARRVIGSHHEIISRRVALAMLVAMIPGAGLFCVILLMIVLPFLLLTRRQLAGAPEEYQVDSGGLGCATLVVVVVLSSAGGWLSKGFDWLMKRVDLPHVAGSALTNAVSVLGTLGTFLLAMAIVERAELRDIGALLRRLLHWRVIGAVISLHVRITICVVLTVMPIATLGVAAFQWLDPDGAWLQGSGMAAFILFSVVFALIAPLAYGYCVLLGGRMIVRLFPEPPQPMRR